VLPDPVPGTDTLELVSGKGIIDEVLEGAVPEENAVTLLVRESEEPDGSSVAVAEKPVPGRLPVSLFVGVVELLRG
jgi:hypothetical protein